MAGECHSHPTAQVLILGSFPLHVGGLLPYACSFTSTLVGSLDGSTPLASTNKKIRTMSCKVGWQPCISPRWPRIDIGLPPLHMWGFYFLSLLVYVFQGHGPISWDFKKERKKGSLQCLIDGSCIIAPKHAWCELVATTNYFSFTCMYYSMHKFLFHSFGPICFM